MFDPPYAHYKGKDDEQKEAYSRIFYVDQQVRKHISDGNGGWTAKNVYVDLAKGSTTKHLFDIKVYNEESDPDYRPKEALPQKLPAIPVITKQNGKIRPIQDYSFTLQSISDRKISILRVYAEAPIAQQVQEQCIQWFDNEFTNKAEQLSKEKREVMELKKQLEEKEQSVSDLETELDLPSDEPP